MAQFFDDAWLSDYLKKHPYLATRMAQDVPPAPAPPGSPPPPAAPGGNPDEPEGVLLGKVRRLALANSFLTYHTHDSRKSESGFPDCVLAKPGNPGRLIFAELKSARGKLTQEQVVWLDILRRTVPQVEVYTWWPADFANIAQILRRSS